MKTAIANQQRITRIRKRIRNSVLPKVVVFRSNRAIGAQIVDTSGKVLGAARVVFTKGKRLEAAQTVGGLIAASAKEQKITAAVFDRGRFAYHGLVAAVCDGARQAGLSI